MQYNICISMQGILILIFQKSGIKVSRNNCFIFCSKKRDESTIEEDRTIYISNCSARENQLICVTMLRKLPWKRTGCTMGCCIGRQALSRVSLFHPTDMSNAGCISIYAPSQNSPRRGRASFSLPFSPPFSYSRRLVDVRRGISFRYHVCSYDSRCNVPATQVNRFCRFSEWKYFFEEVGFVAWNNFINGYKNHKIILIARKNTNPFIVHFSQYCTKFRDLILKLGKVKILIRINAPAMYNFSFCSFTRTETPHARHLHFSLYPAVRRRDRPPRSPPN